MSVFDFTWHLATDLRWYNTIAGELGALTNPTHTQLVVANGTRKFFCCAGIGNTIFLGGRAYGSGETATLWKSVNGGITWAEVGSDLPGAFDGTNVSITHMHAIGDKIYAAGWVTSGNDPLFMWDRSTDTWSLLGYLSGGSRQAGACYAVDTNEVYFPAQIGHQLVRWNGASLATDATLPVDPNDGGPLAFWRGKDGVDFLLVRDAVNPCRVYRGGFESWTLDKAFAGAARLGTAWGRAMWGDARGNLYVNLDFGATIQVWRRDADTAVWALVHTFSAGADPAGIWGREQYVMASCQRYFALSDDYGLTWTEVDPFTDWSWGAAEIAFAIWCPPASTAPGLETDSFDDRSYGIQISDAGHLTLDSKGQLMRDYSIVSRCRFRLKCRRGQWWADALIGSRFWTLKTSKDAEAKADQYAREALQDLIDSGEIVDVRVTEVDEDIDRGWLGAAVEIELPDGDAADLGFFKLGSVS